MIPIKNVYYMLTYVFELLNSSSYKDISVEEFDNTGDLMAVILIKGINHLIKSGILKEYKLVENEISSIKGKIDFSNSLTKLSLKKGKAICAYDEFSTDCYKNQILKATMYKLLKFNINKTSKKELKQLLLYFNDVNLIDLNGISWNMSFNNNNSTYKMLIFICYLINKGLIQKRSDNSYQLLDYLDDIQMHKLYERFILNYYKKEFPKVRTNASKIEWQLDDDISEMLPTMQTDVTLEYGNKILILDAKYYSSTFQTYYDRKTIHSSNIYQIFTYVKNKEYEIKSINKTVSGMLLYARTDQEIQPDYDYKMSGNLIIVKTLDLNCDFSIIKEQLNDIIEKYLLDI